MRPQKRDHKNLGAAHDRRCPQLLPPTKKTLVPMLAPSPLALGRPALFDPQELRCRLQRDLDGHRRPPLATSQKAPGASQQKHSGMCQEEKTIRTNDAHHHGSEQVIDVEHEKGSLTLGQIQTGVLEDVVPVARDPKTGAKNLGRLRRRVAGIEEKIFVGVTFGGE